MQKSDRIIDQGDLLKKLMDVSFRWKGPLTAGALLVLLLSTGYTNCARQFQAVVAPGPKDYSSLTGSPNTTLYPGTPPPLNALPSNEFISSKKIVRLNGNGTEEVIGENNPNCMSDQQYDACLVWKNPVAARGGAYYSDYFKTGMDLSSEQTFGVKFRNRIRSNLLTSISLHVASIDQNTAKDSAGDFVDQSLSMSGNGQMKVAYTDEPTFAGGKNVLAQMMTYFWLDHTQAELKRRTRAANSAFFSYANAASGISFTDASTNPLTVYGYVRNVTTASALIYNNAYFVPEPNDEVIAIGYAASSKTAPGHELGLNAEVSIHEFGHANFYYARNKQPITNGSSQSGTTDYCPDVMGCLDGLDEGQADFHSLMIFSDSPSIGDLFIPNQSLRDVRKLQGKTVQDLYNQSAQTTSTGAVVKGEIHEVGNIYASLLWETYSDSRLDKRAFEATFLLHLQSLSSSSNFLTARAKLIAIDQQFFHGRNSAIIEQVFRRRGI